MKPATPEVIAFRERWMNLGFKNRTQVANEIGVSADAVKKWENGDRPIPKYAWNALDRTEKLKRRKRAGA